MSSTLGVTRDAVRKFPPGLTESRLEYEKRLASLTGIKRGTILRFLQRNPKFFEKAKTETDEPGPDKALTEKEEYSESDQEAEYSYEGPKVIKTIAQAVKQSGVDERIWYVVDKRFKTYTTTMKLKRTVIKEDGTKIISHEPTQLTGYSCYVKFAKYEMNWALIIKDWEKQASRPPKIKKVKGSGVGVAATADYHIGAKIKNLPRTPDFSLDIIRDKLIRCAEKINKHKYKEVHLMIAGDLVESITGLNHLNTFKSLEQGLYGERIIILAFEMIRDCYISRIKNLKSVNMVSGNHDRITMKMDADNEGAACGLIAYLLRLQYPDLEINQNSIVLTKTIDGINYLLLHGHHKMSKKSLEKIFFDYGDTSKYNVLIEGHIHSRFTKKTHKIVYDDSEIVSMDELKGVKIVCRSLFTGNFYSETLGFASNSGTTILENNGSDLINTFDYIV